MQSKATSASSVPHLPLILLELHQSFLHPQLASPRPTVCHSAHLPRPRPLNSGTDFVTCWGRSATNCLRSAKSFRSGTAPGTGWFPQKLKAESWVVLPTSCGKPGFLGVFPSGRRVLFVFGVGEDPLVCLLPDEKSMFGLPSGISATCFSWVRVQYESIGNHDQSLQITLTG